MDFTYYQPWYIGVLRYIYYDIESIQSVYRFMDDLEKSGDFGVFWNILSAKLAQTRQMSSYGWRYSHRQIEPIFLHMIYI